MSQVVLITIKQGLLKSRECHFREAIGMFNSPTLEGEIMDSGYILVDFDSKTIVNKQSAFSRTDLKGKVLEFDWIELI
ncbi:MAG: hypothetical protein V1837_05790 [Candidatus Woesearchaeota archaeon]